MVRPSPEFSPRDLVPGDIIVRDPQQKLHATLKGFNLLVLGKAREAMSASQYVGPVLRVKVFNFTEQLTYDQEFDEYEIIEDRVYRDGKLIWDYDNRLWPETYEPRET